MSRDLSGTQIRSATDIDGSYQILAKADVYPSRIFFSTITSDHDIVGGDTPDPIGIVDSPLKQDIIYSATLGKLVTFWCSDQLHYAVEGSSTIHDLGGINSTIKPGVFGSYIFSLDNGRIVRCHINWGTPITINVGVPQATPTHTPVAVHAVSETECIVIEDNDGGFRAEYIPGTDEDDKYMSDYRFMFPSLMPYDKSTLTMAQQGIASGAAKLGNKVFVYMTNASTGMVEGMYYDLDNSDWSDVFVALPTDLDVSLCSFKIANVYEHNGTIYMCGQFARTDSMNTSDEPYSLLLYSTDGKTFAVDRFVLVSNIGYRFLATVGTNNKLYLGNCNRVCYADVTWVFDGINGTHGKVLHLTRSHIKSISDQNLEKLTMVLISGKEEYFDSTYVVPEARVVLWLGLTTFVPGNPPTVGIDDYVVFGTYIIDDIQYSLQSGVRSTQVDATGEATWKLSGLSMPFYAEILGKSVHYDPLLTDSTELSPAGNVFLPKDSFSIDMWRHEGWTSTDTTPDTDPIDMHEGGGVTYYVNPGNSNKCLGIITDEEIQTILALDTNPKITATEVDINVYGWSHPATDAGGQHNDHVKIVLITADEDGVETIHYPGMTGNLEWGQWTQSWPPPTVTHTTPIPIHITGLTIGHTIKKVGVVVWCDNATWFNIARLDFIAGVQVQYTFYDGDSTWDMDEDGNWKVPRAGRPFVMYAQRPYNTHMWSVAGSFGNTVAHGSCITNYPVGYGLVGFGSDNNNYIVGRYNVTTLDFEIVLVRDGVETLLAHTAGGLDAHPILKFEYKGGRFNLYYVTASSFQLALTYEWSSSDGYMFTDRLDSMKCGIYGCIGVPYARTLGYYPGESEGTTNADGLAIDPIFSIADFPPSGKLRIGDDVYTYAGKATLPAHARGPYQYRSKDTGYTDPAGAGLECRDFYWAGGAADFDGCLVAMDDGTNFVIHGALWQVPNYDDPPPDYDVNRTRYYSDNTQIGTVYHGLGNKVWVTGGFLTLVQKNSTVVASKHSEGEMCNLEIVGDINCYWYSGAGGDDDTVVEDMIDRVCRLSGVVPVFPGDLVVPTISDQDPDLDIITIPYAEGIDFSYEHDWFGESDWFLDVKIDPEQVYWPDHASLKSAILNDTSIQVRIMGGMNHVGSTCDYIITIYSKPSNTIVYYDWFTGLNAAMNKWRVVVFGNNISFYLNGQWIDTKPFDKLVYGTSLTLGWAGVCDLTNVVVKELGDWREAIYIDLETDGQSAVNSVIQQRLVEINGLPDGTIQFFMDITRPRVTAVRAPRIHKIVHSVPTDGASDAIIYGPLDVKTMQNAAFAEDLGFSTKLFRMPDLTIGATRATQLILEKSYQSRHKYDLTIRPDLELVIGDEYEVSFVTSGTGRAESHIIIIESIATNVRMSDNKLTSVQEVYGRETHAIIINPD